MKFFLGAEDFLEIVMMVVTYGWVFAWGEDGKKFLLFDDIQLETHILQKAINCQRSNSMMCSEAYESSPGLIRFT